MYLYYQDILPVINGEEEVRGNSESFLIRRDNGKQSGASSFSKLWHWTPILVMILCSSMLAERGKLISLTGDDQAYMAQVLMGWKQAGCEIVAALKRQLNERKKKTLSSFTWACLKQSMTRGHDRCWLDEEENELVELRDCSKLPVTLRVQGDGRSDGSFTNLYLDSSSGTCDCLYSTLCKAIWEILGDSWPKKKKL